MAGIAAITALVWFALARRRAKRTVSGTTEGATHATEAGGREKYEVPGHDLDQRHE